MTQKEFWTGFGFGALAGAGIGAWAYARANSGESKARFDTMKHQGHGQPASRKIEAGGSLLEGVRGGTQKIDRGRIEADKREVYSPTTSTNFSGSESSAARGASPSQTNVVKGGSKAPNRERQSPQSAGWDEDTSKAVPAKATGTGGANRERTSSGATSSSGIAEKSGERGNKVDYTRPSDKKYP